MRNLQSLISNTLQTQFERETADVMRRLQATRRGEVKALAKKHRDRDELVRVKREFASALVERGVAERVRVAQSYEAKRDDLVRQHELVRLALAEHKTKVTIIFSTICIEKFNKAVGSNKMIQ